MSEKKNTEGKIEEIQMKVNATTTNLNYLKTCEIISILLQNNLYSVLKAWMESAQEAVYTERQTSY